MRVLQRPSQDSCQRPLNQACPGCCIYAQCCNQADKRCACEHAMHACVRPRFGRRGRLLAVHLHCRAVRQRHHLACVMRRCAPRLLDTQPISVTAVCFTPSVRVHPCESSLKSHSPCAVSIKDPVGRLVVVLPHIYCWEPVQVPSNG